MDELCPCKVLKVAYAFLSHSIGMVCVYASEGECLSLFAAVGLPLLGSEDPVISVVSFDSDSSLQGFLLE